MQNGHKIQLGSLDHAIDWQAANRAIAVRPGRIVVEMLPEAKAVGSILLPPTVGANLRPDLGVVLASGWKLVDDTWMLLPNYLRKRKGKFIAPPMPGTIVCVRPTNGNWIESADMGSYKPGGQVRVYGTYTKFTGTPIREAWWHSVVCEAETMNPYGENILLRLDPEVEKEGTILLSDGAKYQPAMATILAVGKAVFDVEPGQRWLVNKKALKEKASLEFDFSAGAKELWLCTPDALEYAVHIIPEAIAA